jgi:hypothetical protein
MIMKYFDSADSIQANQRPETVMSLVDLSPSMDEDDWKPSRLAGAITANIKLMEIKSARHRQDKIGLIGFWRKAVVLHAPVNAVTGLNSLKTAIENARGGGGTNFTAALELAEQTLVHHSGTSSDGFVARMFSDIFCEMRPSEPNTSDTGALKRIILLTDGDHNHGGNPTHIADRLKNSGVVIDCIGIGGSPRDVNETLLRQIASRKPDGSIRYWFIGDQEKLVRTYQSLARHIRPV